MFGANSGEKTVKCLRGDGIFFLYGIFDKWWVMWFGDDNVKDGLPRWLSSKESCQAGDASSIPRSGRSPGEGNGNPLQYSCLEIPWTGEAWQAIVHGVAKSGTWLLTKQQCEECMLGMGETKNSPHIALRWYVACKTKTQDQRRLSLKGAHTESTMIKLS